MDSLPEAATCSSTLFLPEYSSARVAEEKIRYAAYNCLAIDTDVSPWEEWASICTQSTIGAELPDKKRWVLPN